MLHDVSGDSDYPISAGHGGPHLSNTATMHRSGANRKHAFGHLRALLHGITHSRKANYRMVLGVSGIQNSISQNAGRAQQLARLRSGKFFSYLLGHDTDYLLQRYTPEFDAQ
jgi:hypothetical protein